MKKVSIVLCFILIFGFCLAGCGTPTKNSFGDSSGTDRSKREEVSQVQERSKTETDSKTEVSSNSGNNSVSEQSSPAPVSSDMEESSQPEEASLSEDSSLSEDAAWASAYLTIVEDLQAEYGEGRTIIQDGHEIFAGLVVVSLIDFDADGQMELFCGYRSADEALAPIAYQEVYGYSGGQVELYFDEPASMKGGANPGSVVRIAADGRAYIIRYSGQAEDYLMLQNGEFVTAHHIDYNTHSWDGIEMTLEQFSSVKSDFWGDSSLPVAVWYISTNLSNGLETLTNTQDTIESLDELAGFEQSSAAHEDSAAQEFFEQERKQAGESSALADQEQMLQAYREIITDLESEHGTAEDGEYYRIGLCMAKLIDFNQDGAPELFCSYSIHNDGVYWDEIYQYQEHKAVRIYQHQGSNQGTGVKPYLAFLPKEDAVYLIYTDYFQEDYKRLIGGTMQTVFSFYDAPDSMDREKRVNDEAVTPEQLEIAIREFTGSAVKEVYDYTIAAYQFSGHIPVSVAEI